MGSRNVGPHSRTGWGDSPKGDHPNSKESVKLAQSGIAYEPRSTAGCPDAIRAESEFDRVFQGLPDSRVDRTKQANRY